MQQQRIAADLVIRPFRMLTRKEAARYCGLSEHKFRQNCPISPIVFNTGDQRYDCHDLDEWLDIMKGTGGDSSMDEALAMLK